MADMEWVDDIERVHGGYPWDKLIAAVRLAEGALDCIAESVATNAGAKAVATKTRARLRSGDVEEK